MDNVPLPLLPNQLQPVQVLILQFHLLQVVEMLCPPERFILGPFQVTVRVVSQVAEAAQMLHHLVVH